MDTGISPAALNPQGSAPLCKGTASCRWTFQCGNVHSTISCNPSTLRSRPARPRCFYDDYIIEELPCEANEGFELLSFEVSVYRHNTVIDLGTLTDDYIPVSEIFTTALEKESMGNTAYAAEKATIVDTVYYSGLKAGTEYTLKGVLMDKATGEPLMVGENQVTAEKTFRATGDSGSATMEFTFDASALKSNAVVVFENLYLEDKEIAAHADIEDADQTITFLNPEIGTTATGPNGEKVLDATAETVIVDTVAYTGLQPGQEYT